MQPENRFNIVVIGTGYVGLTTGLALGYLGHRVSCIDHNTEIIEKLNNFVPTIYEPGVEELLREAAAQVRFDCTLERHLGDTDIAIIAVGTPSKDSGATDLSFVEKAAREIGRLIMPQKPLLIVNKSTVPIGTARRVETVIKEKLEKREVCCSFGVASNPEFLREGAAVQNTLYPDRIVLGVADSHAADLLRQMYAPILEQSFTPPRDVPRPAGYSGPALVTTNPASAELIKYAANAFLAVKISFINEFACIAEKVGADIREVARGISLDNRIGPGFLQAGVGWGGSCLPKDTRSILHTAGQYGLSMPLVNAAVEVNSRQRLKVIEKLQETVKVIRGSTIGVLGLSFKPNTLDVRESVATTVIGELLEMGAQVKAFDPVAAESYQRCFPGQDIAYSPSVEEAARDADALVLLTEWEDFSDQPWDKIGEAMRTKIFIDGRNMLDGAEMRRRGYTYLGIGC